MSTIDAGVSHRFPEPGVYRVIVRRGDFATRIEYLTVDAESDVLRYDFDLAGASGRTLIADCSLGTPAAVIAPEGYVNFHASSNSGYGVTVTDTENRVVFDSAYLTTGECA
ncbi:hypothetical protein LTV02_10795 [Nocardia yamanashiensis]|uniref:hypothetical protein n=1 Tax=Nocardia yamanashiensis TaxID=209247 RepID=UPI001E5305F0|nr:hypothetical protein [Nocardia yamanashiensis]UGT43836.1 hypothetical protein LTV02_10795 [Nocardia yamanashiensis]